MIRVRTPLNTPSLDAPLSKEGSGKQMRDDAGLCVYITPASPLQRVHHLNPAIMLALRQVLGVENPGSTALGGVQDQPVRAGNLVLGFDPRCVEILMAAGGVSRFFIDDFLC